VPLDVSAALRISILAADEQLGTINALLAGGKIATGEGAVLKSMLDIWWRMS